MFKSLSSSHNYKLKHTLFRVPIRNGKLLKLLFIYKSGEIVAFEAC